MKRRERLVDSSIFGMSLLLMLSGCFSKAVAVDERPADTSVAITATPSLPSVGSLAWLHHDARPTSFAIDVIQQPGLPDRVIAANPPAVTLDERLAMHVSGWAVDRPAAKAATALGSNDYAMSAFSCDVKPRSFRAGSHQLGLAIVGANHRTYFTVSTPTQVVAKPVSS